MSGSRTRTRSLAVALTASALLAAGCSPEPANPPAASEATESSAAAQPQAPAPAAAEAEPQGLAPLTAEGWGPLTIGMTLAEVTAALGPDSDPEAVGGPDPESCDQFRPERAPEGMLVMVEDGRLTSVSLIRDSRVKTDRGLGLGASAAEVRAAYGPELQSSPHKYVEKPAEYLTVWAKGGGPAERMPPPGSRGIRYEVNSTGKVGTIHAGGSSIGYVEGCA